MNDNMLREMLTSFYATRALDVVKMKNVVPCDISSPDYSYRGRIVEVVFDPVRVPEINGRFRDTGYEVPEDCQVIAVNEDGSILLWGGLNSVYHLAKGERVHGDLDDDHIVFEDILDLTGPFKFRNRRDEINDLLARMREAYAKPLK